MTLAVAHADKAGKAILDAVRVKRPPFSPSETVEEFAALLKTYRITKVVGDHWGGEFVKEPFRTAGITYIKSDKMASDIFRDVLSALNSGKVELLEHQRLLAELIALERRTSRGGRDSIGHPPGGHDDVVNAAAGAILLAGSGRSPLKIDPEAIARFSKPSTIRPNFGNPSAGVYLGPRRF